MSEKIFGAKGKVRIKYDGNLVALGTILSKGLKIPEFYIKTDMDPPHSPTAMSEAFGFESWLYESNEEKRNYIFEICTTDISIRIGMENMHDLSGWLQQYVKDICGIDAQTE